MYVVRDKKTREILHINPAPVSQELRGKDVFHAFVRKQMEVGTWAESELPEAFDIDREGRVVALPGKPAEAPGKAAAAAPASGPAQGPASPHEKIVDGQVVRKSGQELVDEGTLSPQDLVARVDARLRAEVELHFRQQQTPGGHRLDDLARQKAAASLPFRHLPAGEEPKKGLLAAGMIYPDAVLDEILAAVGEVQAAYRAAKAAVTTAAGKGQAVAKWEGIALADFLPGAKKPPAAPAKPGKGAKGAAARGAKKAPKAAPKNAAPKRAAPKQAGSKKGAPKKPAGRKKGSPS